MLTRRQLLKQSAWLAAFAGGFMSMESADAGKKRKFKLGLAIGAWASAMMWVHLK
jgi:hypothetical protein